MIYIKKKGTINVFSYVLTSCIEHYALEITGGQSWPNYKGLKRETLRLSNLTSVYILSPEGGVVWNVPYFGRDHRISWVITGIDMAECK